MVIQINKMTVLEYLNVWIQIWHEWHKWKKYIPLAEKCAPKQRVLYNWHHYNSKINFSHDNLWNS